MGNVNERSMMQRHFGCVRRFWWQEGATRPKNGRAKYGGRCVDRTVLVWSAKKQ